MKMLRLIFTNLKSEISQISILKSVFFKLALQQAVVSIRETTKKFNIIVALLFLSSCAQLLPWTGNDKETSHISQLTTGNEGSDLGSVSAANILKIQNLSNRCKKRLDEIGIKDTSKYGWSGLLDQQSVDYDQIGYISRLYPVKEEVSLLLLLNKNGALFVADLASGRFFPLIAADQEFSKFSVSDDLCLMSKIKEGVIQVTELHSGTKVTSLSKIQGAINSVDFSPNDFSLLIGSADTRVYRWHYMGNPLRLTSYLPELERYIAHPTVVSRVKFHESGRIFFSGDWYGSVNAWAVYDGDTFGGKYDKPFNGRSVFTDKSLRRKASQAGKEVVEYLLLDSSGKYLYIGFQTGRLEIWKLRGLLMVASAQLHRGAMLALTIAPSGKSIASVGRDGFLRVWSIAPDQKLIDKGLPSALKIEKVQEVHAEEITAMQFVNDQQFVAGTSSGRVFKVSLNDSATNSN